MRITEPYNGTEKDKNYVKEYLYVILKNDDDINNMINIIYPQVINIKKLLKADIDVSFIRFTYELKETISKYNLIENLKNILIDRYIELFAKKLKSNLNRSIKI